MSSKRTSNAGAMAKIAPPRLHQVVNRERLFRQLDEFAAVPCTWIQGPPGAGKTTLCGSYVEARETRVLWCQVDVDDADPSTFFHYLGQAAPQGDPPLPALTPEFLPELAGFARRFFRLLYERMDAGAVLVLDNYHDMPADSLTQSLVAIALGEVPAGCRLLIISREEPPPALVEQCAQGRIEMLGADALKFTADEVCRMARLHGVPQLGALESQFGLCDGWAAGITLMLQGVREHPGSRGAQQVKGRDRIFEYFAHQLLRSVDEGTRLRLAEISLLPQFTVAMATALTRDDSVVREVEGIFRRQLFIDRRYAMPGDGQDAADEGAEAIYQFHALFRDYLYHLLRQACGPEELHARQLRAAALLEANGFTGAALALYHAAGAWARSASLIVAQAPALNAQGRWMSLLEYIERLPAEVMTADLNLQYWHGMALLARDLPKSRMVLSTARASARVRGDTLLEIAAISGIIWGQFLEGVSMPDMAQSIPDLERLCDQTAGNAPDLEVLAQFALHTAALWARPDHPALPRSANRLMDLFHLPMESNQKCMIATSILHYLAMTGRSSEGIRFAARYDQLSERDLVSPVNDLSWRLAALTSSPALIFGREGGQRAAEVVTRGETLGLAQPTVVALMVRIFFCVHSGEMGTAGDLLKKQALLAPAQSPMLYALRRFTEGVVANASGDFHRACGAGGEAYAIVSKVSAGFLTISWGTILAGSHVGLGDLARARELLDQVQAIAGRTPFRTLDCGIGLTDAYLRLKSGDNEGAKAAARAAFRTMRDNADLAHGTLQMLHVLPRMLAFALEHSIEATFAVQMIQEWRIQPPPGASEYWPWPVRIRALGRWEIEIDGLRMNAARKLPAKLSDLLRWLVLGGGVDVEVDQLQDALWPELEGDQAHQAFTNALHRLRRALGDQEVLILLNGKLSLDPRRCWMDIRALEDLESNFEHDTSADPAEMSRRLLRLYGGKLTLPGNAPIAFMRRQERLHVKFGRIAATLGARLEAAGRHEDATRLYAHVLDKDDSLESIHKGLIRTHVGADNESAAREALVRCEAAMRHHFDRQPSRDVQALLMKQA